MYISLELLKLTLQKLEPIHPFFGTSFLAFKSNKLPIEQLVTIDISGEETKILEKYYNPLATSSSYYIPLRAEGRKDRWVSKKKYTTSGLQKLRTTTFAHAFKRGGEREWAWSGGYAEQLAALQKERKIPAFYLACWLFREQKWEPTTEIEDIVNFFFEKFQITEEEKILLFTEEIEPIELSPLEILSDNVVTWRELRSLTDSPKDAPPEQGGGLTYLELTNVGPAKSLEVELAERLNIITGDNGLGKTFLLECAWWALSGTWANPNQPVYPRDGTIQPSISYRLSNGDASLNRLVYNKNSLAWNPNSSKKQALLPGIVLYMRVDGSCSIWDPAKNYWSIDANSRVGFETPDALRLTQDDIWNGLRTNNSTGGNLCNGIISDWIVWQYKKSTGIFDRFSQVLHKLSPIPGEFVLEPSDPIKIPRDTREIPTLKMPYGDVPILYLSAGIKRIISIAYLLVWAWETHKEAANFVGRAPESKLVIIIDEMEAHLHPRWQRVVVPAILDVINLLETKLEIQLIVATHSPLVLASVEPQFDQNIDKLFTLDLIEKELEIEDIFFSKHGSVDAWLTSEAFDLKSAYSVEAEKALADAKGLQLQKDPNFEKVKEVNNRLLKFLSDIDPFWARWKFFAEKHGVKYD